MLEDILGEEYAIIRPNVARIYYRGDLSEDAAIMAILHEMGHELFPEWKSEPSNTSKSEVGVFERDLKAGLEACGVDLTPMLVKDDDPCVVTESLH